MTYAKKSPIIFGLFLRYQRKRGKNMGDYDYLLVSSILKDAIGIEPYREFATRAGVNYSTLSKIINSKTKLSEKMIKKLSAAVADPKRFERKLMIAAGYIDIHLVVDEKDLSDEVVVDEKSNAYRYVKGLSDEEFSAFIQQAIYVRLKAKGGKKTC